MPSKRSGAVENEAEGPQRKKLRKGTQSCWECRRRKIRCLFTSQGATCVHCNQRGLQCVSQDLPDIGRVSQGTDRIARVENLVEEVLGRLQIPSNVKHHPQKQPHDDSSITKGGERPDEPDSIFTGVNVQGISNHDRPGKARSDRSSSDHVDQTRADLLSILPSGRHLATILAIPFDIPGSLMTLPSVQICLAECPEQISLETVLRLPNVNDASLIDLSRSLLMLSSILQGLSQESAKQLEEAGIDHYDLEKRGVRQVRQHVLCNDELAQSSDGVECLAIEAMYWNSAGELRKAWLGIHRAMMIAQMLGFHKGIQGRQSRENSANPLWFFLMCSDRYLSLTLGLPPCTLDDSGLADPEILAQSTPRQQMQRLHCVVSGHILHRKAANGWDVGSIDFVDRILKDAAATMSPEWWAFPNFSNSGEDDSGSIAERHRLMDQMVHYNLVSRLHLPYLLHSGDDCKYDAHRFVTVSASRNVLTRYLSFRSLTSTRNYCCGIDFLMFLAAVTLCIAHIEASRCNQTNPSSSFSYLAHERLGDRGLVIRVLNIVKQSAKETQDSIGAPMGMAINHLVHCEAQAAEGKLFAISRSQDHVSAENMIGEVSDAGDRLDVSIPWIGVIRIEPNRTIDQPQDTSYEAAYQFEPDLSFFGDDYSLQGVDAALFDDLFRGIDPILPDM